METISKTTSYTKGGEYDVIVVGGGPAGTPAAITSARLGMKTLVIEQFNCLGGIATAGGHGHMCMYSAWSENTRVVGGITYEMPKRCAEMGYGIVGKREADFEIEGMKLTLDAMAEEANVDILYHAIVIDAIVEEGRITGVVTASKSGLEYYSAKRVIDATGDGDVLARAGCGFDVGNAEGQCQPVTLMFTIGGVNFDKVKELYRTRDVNELWQEAQKNGDMRAFQTRLMGWWWTPTRPDHVGVNFTHVNNIDTTNAKDLTRATIEARKQAYETIDVYRKYVPGMEACYMISTPNTIGTRESRRVHGLYTLTKEDVMEERRFDDSIGYGSFFIDIHNTKGPGMDTRKWEPRTGFRYHIPYRIILPSDVEGLFVAGRCASATHEALGSLRVMPQCGVMGEAAGVAAVLSIRDGKRAREVDVAELQSTLRKQDAIILDEDIAKANAE